MGGRRRGRPGDAASARRPFALAVLALVAVVHPAGAAPPDAAVPNPAPPAAPAPAAALDPGRAAAEAIHTAEEAFRDRDDPRRLAEAIAAYREAGRLRGGDPAPLLGLARAEAFRALAREDEALDAWSECARAGEAALRIVAPGFGEAITRGEDTGAAAAQVDARGAEALYWLALGTMGFAQGRGISAVLSVRAAARAMMERAAALDERVDHGGPPRALGAWLAALPAAAGGGAAASRAHFERARALAPAYQLTRVLEAERLLVLVQDRAGFEARLGEVIAYDEARTPELAPENRIAKRRARTLLARRDRLF